MGSAAPSAIDKAVLILKIKGEIEGQVIQRLQKLKDKIKAKENQRLQKLKAKENQRVQKIKQWIRDALKEIKGLMDQDLTRSEINGLLEEKYQKMGKMGQYLPLFLCDDPPESDPSASDPSESDPPASDPPVDTEPESDPSESDEDLISRLIEVGDAAEAAMSAPGGDCPCKGCFLRATDPDPYRDDRDKRRLEFKRRYRMHDAYRRRVGIGSEFDPGPLSYIKGRAPRRKRQRTDEDAPPPPPEDDGMRHASALMGPAPKRHASAP